MRCTGVRTGPSVLDYRNANPRRIYAILSSCNRLLNRHDLQSCTNVWQEKPSDIHLDLLDCGIDLSHVGQSLWNRAEADYGWQQSIHTPFDVGLCDRHSGVHSNSDELLQQGSQPILDFHRQSAILCYIYDRYAVRFLYPLSWLQHLGRDQHTITPLRISGHIHRCLFVEPLERRS